MKSVPLVVQGRPPDLQLLQQLEGKTRKVQLGTLAFSAVGLTAGKD